MLALLLIPILLVPELFDLGAETQAVFDALDYLIWGVFAADLLAKVAIAPARGRYLRTHWIDVVLVALPMLRPLRLARSPAAAGSRTSRSRPPATNGSGSTGR